MDHELINRCFCVILSGGSGTRFWPKSTRKRPKQLCSLSGGKLTLIEETLQRLDGFIPANRRMIVTHKDQLKSTQEIAGDACQIYLSEPESRNTAAALALAALEVAHRSPYGENAIMISLHADHYIGEPDIFLNELENAARVAQAGYLTLMGVEPEYPETGYGYIECGSPLEGKVGFKVASFREKPDIVTATNYINSKNFYWNSGIFVWKVKTLLEELTLYSPASLRPLQALQTKNPSLSAAPTAEFAKVYQDLPKIAIDNAILEKSKKVAMIKARFPWQDLGQWSALEKRFPLDTHGNVLQGDGVLIDSERTTISSDGPFVAALGVKDLIIVAANGSILVCPKERSQDVKSIVAYLESKKRETLY